MAARQRLGAALAAAAVHTVQRIHRLLDPAQPLDRARRQLLRATAAAFALTPVLLALAPAMLALALGRVPGAAALATLARRAPEYSRPRLTRPPPADAVRAVRWA